MLLSVTSAVDRPKSVPQLSYNRMCISFFQYLNFQQILISSYLKYVRLYKAKSRKHQGAPEAKSRAKTWQARGTRSQQLEHQQVPKWGTEPGVRKGKRSLLACHTRCKCSMETTHNRWRSSSVSRSWNWWKVWLVGKSLLVKDQNVI